MRTSWTLLSALAATAWVQACGSPPPPESAADAYELYGIVLEQVQAIWGGDAEVVIDPRTYSTSQGPFPMFVRWEGSAGLEIESPLAAAYNEVNEEPPVLLDVGRLPSGVRYLTEEEQKALEQGSTLWRGNIVILQLARPGFSSSSALLQYGVLCGSLCGEGTWVRFAQSDGRWTVRATAPAWSQ